MSRIETIVLSKPGFPVCKHIPYGLCPTFSIQFLLISAGHHSQIPPNPSSGPPSASSAHSFLPHTSQLTASLPCERTSRLLITTTISRPGTLMTLLKVRLAGRLAGNAAQGRRRSFCAVRGVIVAFDAAVANSCKPRGTNRPRPALVRGDGERAHKFLSPCVT